MEAIVSKVLKKYFKLFIKNFKSDNFSMSIMKGEGTLVDLDLNETIIQDLLLIPPQFRVSLATCDQLSAKIPWTTNFKKEPITISLQNIVIALKEPETIQPIQSQLKKFKKKTKNKRNEITENLQIEVKSLKLNISTLQGTTLMIEIKGVLIQSTNSSFQPVDISQIRNIDKDSGTETLYKLITADSISLSLQDEGGMHTPLIENLPIKILYQSKRRIKDWIQMSAKLEFVLKSLNLNWTLTQWHNIMDLVTTIQSTLARAVPLEPGLTPKSSKDKKKLTSLLKKKEKDTSNGNSAVSPSTPIPITTNTQFSSVGSSPLNRSPSVPRANENGSSPSTTITTVPSPNVNDVNSPMVAQNDLPVPKHSDFSYEFHVEKWQMELVDNFNPSGNGFLFKGDGLHFGFTSANTIFKPTNPETNTYFYQIPIRETILTVIIKALSVQEFSLSSQKRIVLCNTNENSESRQRMKYDKSITSISSNSIPERISIHNYVGPFLLKGNLIFRKPITLSPPTTPPLTPNSNTENIIQSSPNVLLQHEDPLKLILAGGPPLIGMELNLHLNDLNLNGDRRSWKSLISFLMPPDEEDNLTSEDEPIEEIIETSPSINGSNNNNNNTNSTTSNEPDQKKSKILIEKGKKKITTFKRKLKLGDNWKNQIKFSLKATNTELLVRDEKLDQFKALELKINLGSLIMKNHSEWKQVPYLVDGLQLVDKTVLPEPISVSGLDHRISFQIENISTYLLFTNPSDGSTPIPPQAILTPSTISLFVRLSRSHLLNNREKRIPKIDVSFNSLDFNFTLTSLQSVFLDHLANKYLSPKKLKNLLGSRIKNAAKKRLKSMDLKNLDKTMTIKNKVEKTLTQYYVNCFVNIKKGHFHLPLQYLLEPKEKGIVDDSSLINTITSNPLSQIEKLSEIKVELLGILLQNNQEGQNIILKVGSIEAYGIDHPKLSTSTILRPLPIPEDEYIPSATHDNTNLLITYSRKQKKFDGKLIAVDNELNEWMTKVWVKLQGTQVRILKKPKLGNDDPTNTKSTKTKIKMPDIKSFITKAVNLVERRKDKIKDIKKGIKKVNLNLNWGVELGNCEILLGDKSKSTSLISSENFSSIDEHTYEPKGIIKITDTNRKSNAKSYRDMEDTLLENKLKSASSELDKEFYTDKIAMLEQELEILKVKFESEIDKKKVEYEQLEAKYIEMKLSMAELASNI